MKNKYPEEFEKAWAAESEILNRIADYAEANGESREPPDFVKERSFMLWQQGHDLHSFMEHTLLFVEEVVVAGLVGHVVPPKSKLN